MSAPSPTTADFLARARTLVPKLAEREAAATAAAALPNETIEDFRRAGIIRLLRPRRFGGYQESLGTFLRIIEILAEGCASSAWIYAVIAELEWVVATLPEQAQIDIWGENPDAITIATIAPRAVGRRVPGGWIVSGIQPFGSGCLHAQWALIGTQCEDDAGNKVPRYLAMPMRDLRIIYDWQALGMRATGSHSLAIDDIFVPEYRSIAIQDVVDGTTPGRAVHPNYPLMHAPRYYLVPFVLPAVGFTLGRRALAMALQGMRNRTLPPSDALHLQLGELAARIECAHLIFTTRREESVRKLESGVPIPEVDVMRNRRDMSLAFRIMREAVDQLAAISGARSVYDGQPLQSVVRDMATIATHMVLGQELAMVPYGRYLMSGE